MKFFSLIFVFFLTAQNSFATPSTLVTTTLDGKIFDLAAQKNKIVIVNFWTQWCENCRKEMQILDEIYREEKSRELEIIGISLDPKNNRKKVEKVAATVSYPNSMLDDAKKISFKEPNEIPVSYVIGADGEVVKKFSGVASKKDFEQILKTNNSTK